MRSRTSVAALGALLVCSLGRWEILPARGAAADLWPAQVAPLADQNTLSQRIAALEAAGATLPPDLTPAIRFEEVYLRVLARVAEPDWLPQMRALAVAPGTDATTAALRDVAKAWIARVEMRGIAAVLDNFYARNVRYPASLAEVEHELPSDLKMDPWGEAWAYSTHAPTGFAQEAAQRYTLGPRRYPNLGTLREATVDRPPFTPPAWKMTLRPVGASSALEFSRGASVLALLQAGGKIDAYTLVYIGDHWALLAAPDQLFTESF